MSKYSIEDRGDGIGAIFYDGIEVGEIVLRKDSSNFESVSLEEDRSDRTFIRTRRLEFVTRSQGVKTNYQGEEPEWFGPQVVTSSIGVTGAKRDRHVDLDDLETFTRDEAKALLDAEAEDA